MYERDERDEKGEKGEKGSERGCARWRRDLKCGWRDCCGDEIAVLYVRVRVRALRWERMRHERRMRRSVVGVRMGSGCRISQVSQSRSRSRSQMKTNGNAVKEYRHSCVVIRIAELASTATTQSLMQIRMSGVRSLCWE
jgi:hypothetical protein